MYRNIETSIWTDQKFRGLAAPGKFLFLYLITNPHAHVSGIYYLPDVTITHESSIKPDALNTLWDTLSGTGLAFRDQNSEVVWVKNMFRYQGSGEKLVAAAAIHLGTLHNSCLVPKFMEYYPSVAKVAKRRGIHRVSRSRLQEQEQEQDQEGAAPSADEVGEDGEKITAETVYRAYPKHVEPDPSRKSISEAVRYLRKRGTSTPWAWLLGKVRMYADAREKIETADPNAGQYVPACHRWMRKKRYEEDPSVWAKEVSAALAKVRAPPGASRNGARPSTAGSVTRTEIYGKVD